MKKTKIEPTKLNPYDYYSNRGVQNVNQDYPDPFLSKILPITNPEQEQEIETKVTEKLIIEEIISAKETNFESKENDTTSIKIFIENMARSATFPKQIYIRFKKESPEQIHILSKLNAETLFCLGCSFSESFLGNLIFMIFEKFHDQLPNLTEDLQSLKNNLPEQQELRQELIMNFFLEKVDQLFKNKTT